MYQYVRTFPYDRENGWSHELNGVCHDKDYWFFTQNGRLWKFPVEHNLQSMVKGMDQSKRIYKSYPRSSLEAFYPSRGTIASYHLGDLDYYNGYLFVPVVADVKVRVNKKGDTKTRTFSSISVFKASDLSFVRDFVILREDNYMFSSLGWLAINPNNGLLYTSDHTIDVTTKGKCSRIHIYKIGDVTQPAALTLHSTAIILDENNTVMDRSSMQGGCFDEDNHLYISNGWWTLKGSHDYTKNDKGGISVFKTSLSPKQGQNEMLYRLTHSKQTGGFRFRFGNTGDEPEGLTYWDLDKDRRAPGIDGQLHAIMLNNTGPVGDDDDFYFMHFKRYFNTNFYRVTIKTGNVDGAGTDAGIFITFHGAKGVSNECELDSPGDDFERGSTGYYLAKTVNNVGALDHIVIRSDNAGKYAEYYLESVTVQDMESGYYYDFTANLWLNKSRCSCTLTPTRKYRPRTRIRSRS